MAGDATTDEAVRGVVGPLGFDDLLRLTDEMLERGVIRFEYSTGLVEFAPQTLQAVEAKRATATADSRRATALAEAGSLVVLNKRERVKQASDELAEALHSA